MVVRPILYITSASTKTMELGESIDLVDFVEREPGELVVVKKIIGHAVKNFMETVPQFERLTIRFAEQENAGYLVEGVITFGGAAVTCEVSDSNKFFALDGCLKQLRRKIS